MGAGVGRSKKEAEQRAAAEAYARIAERLAPGTESA
jgi:dsRNA-specific ribonuclease